MHHVSRADHMPRAASTPALQTPLQNGVSQNAVWQCAADGTVSDTAPIADGTAPIPDDGTAPIADGTAPIADGTAPIADVPGTQRACADTKDGDSLAWDAPAHVGADAGTHVAQGPDAEAGYQVQPAVEPVDRGAWREALARGIASFRSLASQRCHPAHLVCVYVCLLACACACACACAVR
jgi:hypothetical protein